MVKRKEEWKRFALYPLESWFGWWKVRCVCMDENAYFLDCVTVAWFRSKELCLDFIQSIEVSEGYGQLFGDASGKRTITSEESGPIWSDQMEGTKGTEQTNSNGKG